MRFWGWRGIENKKQKKKNSEKLFPSSFFLH